MKMRPCRPPSLPHICYDLSGFHLLPRCNTDTGAMGIQGRESAAIVDLDIVPAASTPTISGVGNGHGAICGSKDRCTFRGCDISTAMVADFSCDRIGTIALRRGNRTRNR